MGTWCLAALSKVLAGKGIISAPIMRMKTAARPNPHLQDGVPEKWAQSAKYWYENGTRCSRLRRADYYFVLAVGRWLAAKHPTITAPEQWDRNLAVQCFGDDYQHALRRLASYGTRSLASALWAASQTGHQDAELYGGADVLRRLAGMGRYPAKVRPLPQFHSATFGQSSYWFVSTCDRRRCMGKTSVGWAQPHTGR